MSEGFSHVTVYVAGPMTIGDQLVNTKRGIEAAERLFNLGFVPFVPHLGSFWHMMYSHTWDEWLEYDERWLERCDAVLRLPGESRGADREVDWCNANNKPVFDTVTGLLQWAVKEHNFVPRREDPTAGPDTFPTEDDQTAG